MQGIITVIRIGRVDVASWFAAAAIVARHSAEEVSWFRQDSFGDMVMMVVVM